MRFFLLLFLCFPLLTTALLAQPLETSTIEVTISGLKVESKGALRIALFLGDDGWPKFKAAQQLQSLPVDSDQLSVRFAGLPYAENYAILVHHDQNGNDKFDMRWFPYPRPKEGVGVSNNVKGFGSPAFSAASFSVDRPEISLSVEMSY